MAGRPRKSTNVLELTGAFKHDPKRAKARQGEPRPTSTLGPPPAHLTAYELACWHDLVGICHEGSLCRADGLIVEHGARILAALRAAPVQSQGPLMTRYEAVLGKLGLTPADRSRVSVIPPKPEGSPFGRFKPAGQVD